MGGTQAVLKLYGLAKFARLWDRVIIFQSDLSACNIEIQFRIGPGKLARIIRVSNVK